MMGLRGLISNGRITQMVTNKGRAKTAPVQGDGKRLAITADTPYEVGDERLSSYGGLLPLLKMLDLIGFKEAFEKRYTPPKRHCELGDQGMLTGFLMLLFIGFHRLGHFEFIRRDPMVCGALKVEKLPAASTFWRYLRSLCIVQSKSLLRLSGTLRQRVWAELGWAPEQVSGEMGRP